MKTAIDKIFSSVGFGENQRSNLVQQGRFTTLMGPSCWCQLAGRVIHRLKQHAAIRRGGVSRPDPGTVKASSAEQLERILEVQVGPLTNIYGRSETRGLPDAFGPVAR